VRLPCLHERPGWESRRAAGSAASALGLCALGIVSPSGQASRLQGEGKSSAAQHTLPCLEPCALNPDNTFGVRYLPHVRVAVHLPLRIWQTGPQRSRRAFLPKRCTPTVGAPSRCPGRWPAPIARASPGCRPDARPRAGCSCGASSTHHRLAGTFRRFDSCQAHFGPYPQPPSACSSGQACRRCPPRRVRCIPRCIPRFGDSVSGASRGRARRVVRESRCKGFPQARGGLAPSRSAGVAAL
jgi:hypothetical protein